MRYISKHMSLEQATAEWDGKSADEIHKTFKRHQQDDNFVECLIDMLRFPNTQKGASWQLKAFLEQDGTISADQVSQIYNLLSELKDWESRLHILQSMPYMPIAKGSTAAVEAFLRSGMQDKNKFVRAWSYNGFSLLGSQHQTYAAEANQLLKEAMIHEAPSVKARIRNILKAK